MPTLGYCSNVPDRPNITIDIEGVTRLYLTGPDLIPVRDLTVLVFHFHDPLYSFRFADSDSDSDLNMKIGWLLANKISIFSVQINGMKTFYELYPYSRY